MPVDWSPAAGNLSPVSASQRPDLLADPVVSALRTLAAGDAEQLGVAEIDPELADTADFCEHYGSPLDLSANCVVVSGKRAGEVRYAACMVLATGRVDVNNAVRRRLDVRKASFTPMDTAVKLTGMAYGGITPFGVPDQWPVLVDEAVAKAPVVVVGSGLRSSKLLVPGEVVARVSNAEVLPGLAL